MLNKEEILETLQLQNLSEEDKNKRHILGRLYGPIATCKESTRNGRRYNKQLWENALKDDLFKEKIANKCLFLELGHPANREEIDMREVCACIPESPKIVNDDLYAYVDILDTVNGRTLKTLCDYGFIPGISSRGSGDIMPNDEVDPDSFFLETWDIVSIPAVKRARLAVCENLDTNAIKMRKALQEAYNQADEKDREVMKKALDNLNISLEEAEEEPIVLNIVPVEECDKNKTKAILSEDAEEEVSTEVEDSTEEKTETEIETPEEVETEEVLTQTVGELMDSIKDFNRDLALEFEPIVFEDKEIHINNLTFNDEEEGKIVVTINHDYTPEMEDNIESEEVEDAESEQENTEDLSAVDNGEEEVVESLKEAIRQKDVLEQKIKTLQNEKAVDDVKVNELEESLAQYKNAFVRMSNIAAQVPEAEEKVLKLTEALQKKDLEIKQLVSKSKDAESKLFESYKAQDKASKMQESLTAKQVEIEQLTEKLSSQSNSFEKQMSEKTAQLNKYKSHYNKIFEHYISFRASMLGVNPTEIKNRLSSYTVEAIDEVCDNLLTESYSWSSLPTSKHLESKAKVTINTPRQRTIEDECYEELLDLAGLK